MEFDNADEDPDDDEDEEANEAEEVKAWLDPRLLPLLAEETPPEELAPVLVQSAQTGGLRSQPATTTVITMTIQHARPRAMAVVYHVHRTVDWDHEG